MEREELERQVVEIIRRTVSAVNEILTPLEDDPEEYLAVINRIADNMVRTATNAITPKPEKPSSPPVIETAEISIEQFENEYTANPIKARRQYSGKVVQVNATMNEFVKYLDSGASPSGNAPSERKYMYKNICVAVPGTVASMNELTNKEGAVYEVRLNASSENDREWELVAYFPKEAGKKIENLRTGQLIIVKGHYEGRRDSRYFLRDCEIPGDESDTGGKKNTSSSRRYMLIGATALAVLAAVYYFLK